MAGIQSTVVDILRNVKQAALDFIQPYQTPAQVPDELKKLIKQLGFRDPQQDIKTRLETVVQKWRDAATALSGVNLNFIDPVNTMRDIEAKSRAVQDALDTTLKAPADAVRTLAGFGGAV